ncbi:hypothetical protein T11_3557 [Trichinella zimbabwensis]|uniref:Uncharacterized protein n=1 Tax=Trichinella zimbabwensis TaxID=268475 RepID=A0A0V1HZD5_9BILA|nr:hypothetical protein T11_3557 [Trichinella zimbabwensis]
MGEEKRRSARLARLKNQQLLLESENDTDLSEELHNEEEIANGSTSTADAVEKNPILPKRSANSCREGLRMKNKKHKRDESETEISICDISEQQQGKEVRQPDSNRDKSTRHHSNKIVIYVNPTAFRGKKPKDKFNSVPLKKIFSAIESQWLDSSQNLEQPTTSKVCFAQLEKPNIECLLRNKDIKLSKESTEIYRKQDDIFQNIVNDTKKFKNIDLVNYYKSVENAIKKKNF